MLLPRRLSYDETCQELLADGFLEEILPLPSQMPRHDDELLGFSLFKGGLEECELANFSLPRTFFCRSFLERCNFSNTDWSESRMCWNDFDDVDFSTADLIACDLRASRFRSVRFCDANLSLSDLRRSFFEGCDFTGAALQGTRFTYSQAAELLLTDEQRQQVRWYRTPGSAPPGG
ncbi:pentapeptide repeat-containing protein [Armatimonas sp.]|uniref:pentapeptide repeat-containing protein n=1 Tax=Armatimonas sp. TaxID=1872638 RepID=UPI0037537474